MAKTKSTPIILSPIEVFQFAAWSTMKRQAETHRPARLNQSQKRVRLTRLQRILSLSVERVK